MSQPVRIVMPDVLQPPSSPDEQAEYLANLHNQVAQTNSLLISKFFDGTNPMPTAELGLTRDDRINGDLMSETHRNLGIVSGIVDVVDKDDPSIRYTVGRPDKGSQLYGQNIGIAVTLKTKPAAIAAVITSMTLFRTSLPQQVQAAFDAESVKLKQETATAEAVRVAELATQQAQTQAFIEAITSNNLKPLTTRQKLGKAATHFFRRQQ